MRSYLITSVVDSISANTNSTFKFFDKCITHTDKLLFSLYLTIVGHCCLHQVISRQVCWQSQIIEWDNPGQPCYCAERQIHISLKFKWLFLWYSREWIGVPKSFKSKDGKSYPNRSKTHRNMKISKGCKLQFALFSVLMACPGRRDIKFLPTNNHQNARNWVLSCIYCTAKLSPYWSLLAHPARGAYLGFHVATKSITTPPCMGCQSIARLPPSISLGFPENSPEAIYTPGWRERQALWEESVVPKNTKHWPGQVSNPDLLTRSPVHWPFGDCVIRIMQTIVQTTPQHLRRWQHAIEYKSHPVTHEE